VSCSCSPEEAASISLLHVYPKPGRALIIEKYLYAQTTLTTMASKTKAISVLSALGQMRKDKVKPPKDTQPSFTGRTVLITGANTGVGFEAAVKFVQCGVEKLIFGVRTIQKGEDARAQIEERTGRKGVIEVWQLDMLDYESVQAFAARADKELERLDIAVLNAGVVMGSHQLSKYGWEKTLQINTLSTTLLAMLLLPKLKASKTADYTPVLEIVSSQQHYVVLQLSSEAMDEQGKGPLKTYSQPDHFDSQISYGVSKLFLEYTHTHLSRQVLNPSTGKPEVIIVSVCPGATKSSLARDLNGVLLKAAFWVYSALLQRPTEVGARTYISGVVVGEEGHGKMWTNDVIKDLATQFSKEGTFCHEIVSILRVSC
jgi:NAD(P)-dependent dehydrogenase (short-subunit alcohol dehydrogenase family)